MLRVIAAMAVFAVMGTSRGASFQWGMPITPLNSAHVVTIRYDGRLRDRAAGVETKGPFQGYPYKDLLIRVTLVEELKGKVRQRIGVPFEMTVREYPPQHGGGRRRASLWLNSELERLGGWGPGTRVMASCDDSSDDLTQLLVVAHCDGLFADPIRMADTRVILDLERRKTSLATVFRAARDQVAARGGAFAEYVGSRVRRDGVTDASVSELIDLAASPAVTWEARNGYAMTIANLLGESSPPRPALETRWIRTLFRLAMSPPPTVPGAVSDNLVDPYLFNAIGLAPLPDAYLKLGYRPRPFHTVEEVFAGAPNERAAAVDWVRNHPAAQWKKPLLDWLTTEQ